MFTVMVGLEGSGKTRKRRPFSKWYSVMPSTEVIFVTPLGRPAWAKPSTGMRKIVETRRLAGTAFFIKSFAGVITTLTSLMLLPAATSGAKEIETVITAFNSAVAANDSKRIMALFTAGGTYQEGTAQALPIALALAALAPKRLPWDERMPLVITVRKIVFLRADTATVDALQTDSTPSGDTGSWSCVFVLVKAASSWKI